MKFLRHLLGITKLDKEKNQCIRGKTGEQNMVKEIKQYQEKWLQHVQRMDINRLPKQALPYKPKGRRNMGRPRKRWRDQLHLEDQRTGSTPKPSWTWWWWMMMMKKIMIWDLFQTVLSGKLMGQISTYTNFLFTQAHFSSPLNFNPCWLSWTLPMVYYKKKKC